MTARTSTKFRIWPGLASVLLFTSGMPGGAAAMTPVEAASSSSRLMTLADEVFAWRLATTPQLRLERGLPITHVVRITLAEVEADAARASAFATALSAIAPEGLTADQAQFRLALLQNLRAGATAAQDYWHDFDVTPYRGGALHNLTAQVLAAARLATSAERQAYLALIDDYAGAIDAVRIKTLAQRQRGILLPTPAIASALTLIEGVMRDAPGHIAISPARLAGVPAAEAARFQREVQARVSDRVLPALAALRAVFDDGYRSAAPNAVGLSQYPGGAERYRRCIAASTGLPLTPDQIHAIGLRAIEDIDRRLAEIRTAIGFAGDRAAFDAMIRRDPRWIATSPEDVVARYERYIAKIVPVLPTLFEHLPAAPYGVQRLDPASEPGQTFGYYRPPSAAEPRGIYYFNGSGLENKPMISAQQLIYHELVPGHHLQLSLARERPSLHPLESTLQSGAYTEGWAVYASWLGEDVGLYEPYELYGHLLSQSFLATRLVVDTGMNDLGWSLDRARAYMRAHVIETDAQIVSESLRYSTDLPCQALGYFLGYNSFREGRARAQAALGTRFDIRRFHSAVLTGGSVPLNLVERRIDDFIAQERARP